MVNWIAYCSHASADKCYTWRYCSNFNNQFLDKVTQWQVTSCWLWILANIFDCFPVSCHYSLITSSHSISLLSAFLSEVMVYIMIRTNRTFTDEIYPFFEVIYVLEVRRPKWTSTSTIFQILFTILFYLLVPVAFSMLWNAQPLHRNASLIYYLFSLYDKGDLYIRFIVWILLDLVQISTKNRFLQLRLSLCNLVLQGILGISARLVFIYNLNVGDQPLGKTK